MKKLLALILTFALVLSIGASLVSCGGNNDTLTVFVPSDDSNQTRALLLLAQEGFISIPEGKDINTGISVLDLKDENYLANIEIQAVEAQTLPAQLQNNKGAIAVINGNYAIGAGLNVATDALAIEAVDGQAATTYANILAVNPEDQTNPKILALVAALQSAEVANFIASEYEGAVVSMSQSTNTTIAQAGSDNTIKVAASPTPHAEILEVAKTLLAAKGYNLIIETFDDYVLPNNVVFNGECDANYFQHVPYLNSFNAENNMDLVSVVAVHYEPFGIYGNEITLDEAKAFIK